jgi:adenylate cyclase
LTEERGLGLKGWLSGPRKRKREIDAGSVDLIPVGHRVAVLPFANFSPDSSDEYFADGITDEIISTVAGIRALSVISRTSVMGYKGTKKKVGEIGRELGVGSILEGSFKKAGKKIRVTAQLIDATRDRHLWAENYDRELGDILVVQSDISQQIAEVLRVKILAPELERIEKKPTESTVAYTLYLRGRSLWNKRGIDDVRKAVEIFEEATREDPKFALGYVGLADCFLALSSNWGVDAEANREKTRTMLATAIDLDPSLAEAHASLGTLLRQEYHLREAENEYRRALDLKPSYAMVHMWYHLLLLFKLRWSEARSEIEKAVQLDPLSPAITINHANYYLARRDYNKALSLYQRVAESHPRVDAVYWGMAWANGKLGEYDVMKQSLETLVELTRDSFPRVRSYTEALAAYLTNDKSTVERLLPELTGRVEGTYMDAREVAGFYFYLGKIDRGFEWLERSHDKKEAGLLDLRSNELFEGVRSDPRYLDLLKRLELSD